MKAFYLKHLVPKVMKWGVVGTAILSRVVTLFLPASVSAAAPPPETWSSVRAELDGEIEAPVLSAEIVDIVTGADLDVDLQHAVVLSLSLARPEEILALDALWVETIIERGDSEMMARFVALRSNWTPETVENDQGAYLDWQIWRAVAGGGDCDGGAASA